MWSVSMDGLWDMHTAHGDGERESMSLQNTPNSLSRALLGNASWDEFRLRPVYEVQIIVEMCRAAVMCRDAAVYILCLQYYFQITISWSVHQLNQITAPTVLVYNSSIVSTARTVLACSAMYIRTYSGLKINVGISVGRNWWSLCPSNLSWSPKWGT